MVDRPADDWANQPTQRPPLASPMGLQASRPNYHFLLYTKKCKNNCHDVCKNVSNQKIAILYKTIIPLIWIMKNAMILYKTTIILIYKFTFSMMKTKNKVVWSRKINKITMLNIKNYHPIDKKKFYLDKPKFDSIFMVSKNKTKNHTHELPWSKKEKEKLPCHKN